MNRPAVKLAAAKVTADILDHKVRALEANIQELTGSQNPQARAVLARLAAQREAFEDVLAALYGCPTNLRIL